MSEESAIRTPVAVLWITVPELPSPTEAEIRPWNAGNSTTNKLPYLLRQRLGITIDTSAPSTRHHVRTDETTMIEVGLVVATGTGVEKETYTATTRSSTEEVRTWT